MPTMMIESFEKSEVNIAPFATADTDAVVALRLEARKTEPHVFPSSYATEVARTPEEWRARFERTQGDDPSDILMLAKNGTLAVGMIGARAKGEGVWDLHGVYVRPQFRGRHIADDLMRAVLDAIKDCPDARVIEFEAEIIQQAAVEMYKKFGFEIVGTSRRRMGDGKEYDKYVFRMQLQQG